MRVWRKQSERRIVVSPNQPDLRKKSEMGRWLPTLSPKAGEKGGAPGLPMKNRFTVSRTGQTGVLWCRFRDQKGNSGYTLFEGHSEAFSNAWLVLLCYKNWRRQQGHLGRERARWVAIWRRRVAMECGLCRSVLIGSATRFGTVWQAG